MNYNRKSYLSLFTVPISTIILLFTVFVGEGISTYLIVISISAVFLINLLTFYFYETMPNNRYIDIKIKYTKSRLLLLSQILMMALF